MREKVWVYWWLLRTGLRLSWKVARKEMVQILVLAPIHVFICIGLWQAQGQIWYLYAEAILFVGFVVYFCTKLISKMRKMVLLAHETGEL